MGDAYSRIEKGAFLLLPAHKPKWEALSLDGLRFLFIIHQGQSYNWYARLPLIFVWAWSILTKGFGVCHAEKDDCGFNHKCFFQLASTAFDLPAPSRQIQRLGDVGGKGAQNPVEIKKTSSSNSDNCTNIKIAERPKMSVGRGAVICICQEISPIPNSSSIAVSIWEIWLGH
jgi:hypothetical protein